VLFNLRYAALDGKTYSLSSIISQMDLILYAGITAAISFGIAWLASMLITRGFRGGGLSSANHSILFTLFSLYILTVVALVNFSINGWVITWTLPDFLVQFLGFLAVIIALFIALSGLILTGVAALTGWLMNKR
jgi:hypothetical protein